MFRSRWGTYGRRAVDSPYIRGVAAAMVQFTTTAPAPATINAPSGGGSIVAASGSAASLQSEARALIAAGKRASRDAAFRSVPDSAGGGDKGRLSTLRWQAYVNALRNS